MTARAILFDFFDTLVLFDRRRLPEIRLNGRLVHTTAGRLLPILAPYAPGLELPRFYEALIASWQQAEEVRSADHREVPAAERFRLLLSHLGLDPAAVPSEVIQELLSAHKHELSKAAELPPHHRALLEGLAPRFRMGIVSNFDYAPTVHGILQREGIAGFFQPVVVSDQVGWRKPKPVIFETALARLGLPPREALFVGDRADIDVVGATQVGMPVAWVNREDEPLPEGVPTPEYELRDLGELARLLAV
ncbi:MAG: HAD family hydrolase [Candidatus Methylomirabilia bacterium]